MFRIEELLHLFQDDVEVIKIILSTYEVSQRENKKLSDSVFQQLLFLKSTQPNFCIKINYNSIAPSNYNPNENVINLNGGFDETTFLHELTHLFSYYYSKFEIPQEYNEFKKNFLLSSKNTSLVISFLNWCNKEKQRILNEELPLGIEKNKSSNKDFLETTYDYFVICKIEDIIDSIYGGKSHTLGLTHIKDNDSYLQESSKSSGHGCDYFVKNGYGFEEIIADYQAIKMIAPNNQLFILLKQILGDEFVSFLDDRCRVINGEKNLELDLNNNISKK